jgi:flagellar basal-body rod modification protein FlgD
MTTTFPISSATPAGAAAPSNPTTGSSANNALNENTFLTLLVAQLKYQDPMNPADSTQFLTQTAQFTEVQTLQQMEAEQKASQSANQLLAASTMVGHPVSYSLSAGGQPSTPSPTTTISIRGSLSSDAVVGTTSVQRTTVYNEQGAPIPLDLEFTKTATGWTVQAATKGANLGSPINIPFDAVGDHTTNDVTIPASALDGIVGTAGTWPSTGITLGFGEATDPSHVALATGPSTILVAEQDGNDGQTATGIVTSVHLTADGPELIIDGQNIPYSAVTDVQ